MQSCVPGNAFFSPVRSCGLKGAGALGNVNSCPINYSTRGMPGIQAEQIWSSIYRNLTTYHQRNLRHLCRCFASFSVDDTPRMVSPSLESSFSTKTLSDKIATQKDGFSKLASLLTAKASTILSEDTRNWIASIGGTILLLLLCGIHPQPALATGKPAAVAAGGKATHFILKTELLSSAWTGLVAGFLHTLTGPDHLAALAPLSIGRSRIESAAVGALWGCGHDAGQVIFGILFLLLKGKLKIEFFHVWGARIVGISLLLIGAMGVKEALEGDGTCLSFDRPEKPVSMVDNPPLKSGKGFGLATFATGIIHGLQPDALLMILPALALPSRIAGAAFLGMFLVGTIVAMGSYTAFIGSCSIALKKKVPRITEGLSWGSSVIAIALGLALLLSEVFGISLF